ncbi:MAG TPA: hypothetical protein VK634_13635 [Reyranella sp.]|nr:hypothetical protein [Reyranella sp.]HTE81724.1 hypothetical protein [Reyranella sp.]
MQRRADAGASSPADVSRVQTASGFVQLERERAARREELPTATASVDGRPTTGLSDNVGDAIENHDPSVEALICLIVERG